MMLRSDRIIPKTIAKVVKSLVFANLPMILLELVNLMSGIRAKGN